MLGRPVETPTANCCYGETVPEGYECIDNRTDCENIVNGVGCIHMANCWYNTLRKVK